MEEADVIQEAWGGLAPRSGLNVGGECLVMAAQPPQERAEIDPVGAGPGLPAREFLVAGQGLVVATLLQQRETLPGQDVKRRGRAACAARPLVCAPCPVQNFWVTDAKKKRPMVS